MFLEISDILKVKTKQKYVILLPFQNTKKLIFVSLSFKKFSCPDLPSATGGCKSSPFLPEKELVIEYNYTCVTHIVTHYAFS